MLESRQQWPISELNNQGMSLYSGDISKRLTYYTTYMVGPELGRSTSQRFGQISKRLPLEPDNSVARLIQFTTLQFSNDSRCELEETQSTNSMQYPSTYLFNETFTLQLSPNPIRFNKAHWLNRIDR